ncbi:alpha/beta fold hydrolase [Patulibacter minatonensis]|uniref:alpha/beta fold hydrolase n=1 Tax=Patulibacter minatonensis TaxID=298163 RepID=UPI00047C0A62|nr:alpha/beta fold hydrolase [Patulibacter minatonensis]
MPEIGLSGGTITYEDVGPSDPAVAADAPVLVFVHGVLMDGTLWRHVVAGLRERARCVVPLLPLGGHRIPMDEDADMSLRGHVGRIAEFLEKLDLRDVTIVGCDWGGGPLLTSYGLDERVGRYVILPSEAFDNFPPGLPGRTAGMAARMPGGINAAMQPLRFRPLRRLPMTFGWMSKRPVPHDVMDGWLHGVTTDRRIRRDLKRYGAPRFDRDELLDLAERQRAFTGPVLVLWAPENKMMPREHGPRLAELFPDGRLVEVDDSYTLMPEDRPDAVIEHVGAFLAETAPRGAGSR